jgi:dihydroorotase
MLRALKYAKMFDRVVAQHCQDDRIVGQGVMNAATTRRSWGCPDGRLGRGGHAVARHPTDPQDRCPLPRQHISTAGSVELIRQAKKDALP